MTVDPQTNDPREVYHHLVHAIVPRPIGWISTRSTAGVDNVAPYSFFNAVCARPAAVMFSGTVGRGGDDKDTVRNVRDTGVFAVNLVSEDLAEAMNATSAGVPPDESEFDHARLDKRPAELIDVPLVAAAKVTMECRLMQFVKIGEGPMSCTITIGEVVRMTVAEAVLGEDGYADSTKLAAVGRMGGLSYVRTRDVFDLDRPR